MSLGLKEVISAITIKLVLEHGDGDLIVGNE